MTTDLAQHATQDRQHRIVPPSEVQLSNAAAARISAPRSSRWERSNSVMEVAARAKEILTADSLFVVRKSRIYVDACTLVRGEREP